VPIPTEPIGSIPRPAELVAGMQAAADGGISADELDALFEEAVRDTIAELEATGSPVVTDGEQRKPSFATYPLAGLDTLAGDGVVIPFADGHTRQLPVLTAGPFRYQTHAGSYLTAAQRLATRPVKQAVISASALSLLYPADGIEGYSRDAFLADLIDEAEADIRGCLEAGAYNVQIDFTEARLSLKLDPSGGLLRSFVDLNNSVLDRFSASRRSPTTARPRARRRSRRSAPESRARSSQPSAWASDRRLRPYTAGETSTFPSARSIRSTRTSIGSPSRYAPPPRRPWSPVPSALASK
jgi:5-methyltetrahydropteroyltriglutamate--homocysteine methyltransferase